VSGISSPPAGTAYDAARPPRNARVSNRSTSKPAPPKAAAAESPARPPPAIRTLGIESASIPWAVTDRRGRTALVPRYPPRAHGPNVNTAPSGVLRWLRRARFAQRDEDPGRGCDPDISPPLVPGAGPL